MCGSIHYLLKFLPLGYFESFQGHFISRRIITKNWPVRMRFSDTRT